MRGLCCSILFRAKNEMEETEEVLSVPLSLKYDFAEFQIPNVARHFLQECTIIACNMRDNGFEIHTEFMIKKKISYFNSSIVVYIYINYCACSLLCHIILIIMTS